MQSILQMRTKPNRRQKYGSPDLLQTWITAFTSLAPALRSRGNGSEEEF